MSQEETIRELAKNVKSLYENVIPPISSQVEEANVEIALLKTAIDELKAKVDALHS